MMRINDDAGYQWWTVGGGRDAAGTPWLKLGPLTFQVYRWVDGQRRYSVCALGRRELVWPPLV